MSQVKRKKPGKTGRSQSRSRRNRRSYLPAAEQARMIAEYVQGGPNNSIRKIALRFGRDESAVSRVVKSKEVTEVATDMLRSLLVNSAEKVIERLDFELESKRKGGKGAEVALELADRLGILPPKVKTSAGTIYGSNGAGVEKEIPEEKRISLWVQKLTEVTMERGKVFGMPMPELDEVAHEEHIEIPIRLSRKEQAE